MSYYHGTDGNYYTEEELCQMFENGALKVCISDLDNERELVENEDGNLVMLTSISKEEIPEGVGVAGAGDSKSFIGEYRPNK